MSKFESVSLFFPVYNEVAILEATIEKASRSLVQLGVSPYEIILIDDGSTDGTTELADKLAMTVPYLRVVHHPTNLGYGTALQSGFATAQYKWVVYTDSDGQFDLGDLTQFETFAETEPVMIGYRIARCDHFGRKLNAFMWSLIVKLILNLSVRDLDCAFKVIRRDAINEILPLTASGAVISAELLLKLKRRGYHFVEVGVHHYPRVAGESTGANFAVIVKALRELIQLRRQT